MNIIKSLKNREKFNEKVAKIFVETLDEKLRGKDCKSRVEIEDRLADEFIRTFTGLKTRKNIQKWIAERV